MLRLAIQADTFRPGKDLSVKLVVFLAVYSATLEIAWLSEATLFIVSTLTTQVFFQ